MLGRAAPRPVIDCEGTTVDADGIDLDENGANTAIKWQVPRKSQKAMKSQISKVCPSSNMTFFPKINELEEEEEDTTKDNDNLDTIRTHLLHLFHV